MWSAVSAAAPRKHLTVTQFKMEREQARLAELQTEKSEVQAEIGQLRTDKAEAEKAAKEAQDGTPAAGSQAQEHGEAGG